MQRHADLGDLNRRAQQVHPIRSEAGELAEPNTALVAAIESRGYRKVLGNRWERPIDSTRVATVLLGHDGDNRSLPEIGIAEGHHDLSHHFNSEEKIQKLSDIDRWYAQQFARFLQKLKDTPDVDGRSLLHNSMILYGSGNADGNRHTHSNLPLILAGGGGGAFSPGRYVQHGGKPMTNLLLRIAAEMGARNLERFGDSTGVLENV